MIGSDIIMNHVPLGSKFRVLSWGFSWRVIKGLLFKNINKFKKITTKKKIIRILVRNWILLKIKIRTLYCPDIAWKLISPNWNKCYEKFQDISLLYCKTIVVQFCKKFSRKIDFRLIYSGLKSFYKAKVQFVSTAVHKVWFWLNLMTFHDLLSPGLTKVHRVSSNLIKIIFCKQFYFIKDAPHRGYNAK